VHGRIASTREANSAGRKIGVPRQGDMDVRSGSYAQAAALTDDPAVRAFLEQSAERNHPGGFGVIS
jgi:hypothetical protein